MLSAKISDIKEGLCIKTACLSSSSFEVRRRPYLLYLLFLILFLCLVATTTSYLNLIPSGSRTYMNAYEFSFLLVGELIIGCVLLYMGHRYFSAKANWPFLVAGILLFLSDVIAILIFPSFFALPDSTLYTLSLSERIVYISSFFNTVFALYILLAITPQCVRGVRSFDFFLYFIFLLAASAVVYSYIAEWEIYKEMMASSSTPLPLLQSFTNNRNTYGTILMLGFIAVSLLNARSSHWWWPFVMAVFAFNAFLIMSKTASIVIAVYAFGYGIYRYLSSVIQRPYSSSLILAFWLSLIISLGALGAAGLLDKAPLLGYIIRGFRDYFNNLSLQLSGLPTVHSRIDLWKDVFSLMGSDSSHLSFIFGYGDWNFSFLFAFSGGHGTMEGYSHNGLIETLARGGIVRIVLTLAFYAYLFALIVGQISRHKKSVSWLYLLSFMAYFLHSMMESDLLIGSSALSLCYLLLFVVPTLTEENLEKVGHPLLVTYLVSPSEPSQTHEIDPSSFFYVSSLDIFAPASLSVVLLLRHDQMINQAGYLASLIIVAIVAIALGIFMAYHSDRGEKGLLALFVHQIASYALAVILSYTLIGAYAYVPPFSILALAAFLIIFSGVLLLAFEQFGLLADPLSFIGDFEEAVSESEGRKIADQLISTRVD